jgi:elongator complex protein 4
MKGDQGRAPSEVSSAFCHTFDLTKRLVHPPGSFMTFLKIDAAEPGKSPYALALARLASILASSPENSVHRLVIPSLLSPALYPPHASFPEHVLQFFHSLRALLSRYSSRLTAMLTLPLSLYPRSSGLVRWMELLSDGVVELSPFPHSYQPDAPSTASGIPTSQDEPPQGLLKFHRLPILHERGVGTTTVSEDWAFTLSRRKFTINPFSLPPVEGDTEAQQAAGVEQKGKKAGLDF